MAFTTPRTFVTGELVTAAMLNEQIRDNENFLYSPPMCRVYNSAAISIPNSTTTALTFDSERFDTDSMHSTAADTGRITATTGGKYMLGGSIEWAANATGVRILSVRLTAATSLVEDLRSNTGAVTTRQPTSTLYALSAAGYVDLAVNQNSGGALNVNATGNFSPEFWAAWQGN